MLNYIAWYPCLILVETQHFMDVRKNKLPQMQAHVFNGSGYPQIDKLIKMVEKENVSGSFSLIRSMLL